MLVSFNLWQVGGTVFELRGLLSVKLTQKAYCSYRFYRYEWLIIAFNSIKHPAIFLFTKIKSLVNKLLHNNIVLWGKTSSFVFFNYSCQRYTCRRVSFLNVNSNSSYFPWFTTCDICCKLFLLRVYNLKCYNDCSNGNIHYQLILIV